MADRADMTDTWAGPSAAALALVESLPLGEAVILHNRESGAIVASNAFGAMVIEQLRRTPAVPTTVAALAAALEISEDEVAPAVDNMVTRWRADGLFLTALQPFRDPVAFRAPAGGSALSLAFGSRAVDLRAEDRRLLSDIDRAVAPMGLARDTVPDAPPVRLDVIDDPAGYGLFRDGAPVWGAAGYELTRFHLLREIMDALNGPERVAAHLHASAVSASGAGLVFAGASGSGKSTLATLLLHQGAALASDDHVALDISGTAFLAFPTRPNLKPGTEAVPGVAAVIEAQNEAQNDGRNDGQDEGQGTFVPRARARMGAAIPLAGFVFPHFDPEGDNAFEEIAPDAALRELIQTGSRVSRSTRSIAPLLKALNSGPCRRLRYRDTDFALTACRDLLER